MERGGPYMARYAGDRRQIDREMRLYNDLKGHCPPSGSRSFMPLRRVKSDATVVPPVTRPKCARNAASTGDKCADCTRSSQERQSSGPATDSGTPRRILPHLRQQHSRSCKFTTNPVFCATGACRWRGRRPLAPLTLRRDVPDSGRAQDRQPAPPSGPADQELGFVVNLQHFHVSCLAWPVTSSAYMVPS